MTDLQTYINSIRDSSIQLVSNLDENDTFMQSYLNSAAPKSSAAGVYHRAEKKMNELACRIYNWSTAASALERSNISLDELTSLRVSVRELKNTHHDNLYLINKMNGGPKIVNDNYSKISHLIEAIDTSVEGIGREYRAEGLRNIIDRVVSSAEIEDSRRNIGGGDGIEG